MHLIDKLIHLSAPFLNTYGYFIILFLSILEASPITGIVIPGEIIIVLGGFFAKTGEFNLGIVITAAAFGAIIGDFIGYELGRKYGEGFLLKYGKYFLFKPEYFEKTKKLLNEHSGKSLFIGRFNKVTRAFVPFVAGSSKVPFGKFIFFNIIGGISWAVTYVMVGYIFGKSYDIFAKYIGGIVLAAFVLIIISIYAFRYINKKKHIFAKFHVISLTFNAISIYIFSKCVEDLLNKESFYQLDLWIYSKITILWEPLWVKIMEGVSLTANPFTLLTLSLALALFLIYKKKTYLFLLFTSSMVGGLIFQYGLKYLIHRARPEDSLITSKGFSFPSGHALLATLFFAFLIYAFKDKIQNKYLRYGYIGLNISLFIFIGFSRVFLRVHWFSDVISGIALGIFWVTFLIILFKIISFYRNKNAAIKEPA